MGMWTVLLTLALVIPVTSAIAAPPPPPASDSKCAKALTPAVDFESLFIDDSALILNKKNIPLVEPIVKALRELKEGDRIKLSDGSVVELGELLGFGGTTRVFAVVGDKDWVLRIPRLDDTNGKRTDHIKYNWAINMALRNYIDTATRIAAENYPAIAVQITGHAVFAQRLSDTKEGFETLFHFLENLTKLSAQKSVNREKVTALKPFMEQFQGKPELTDIDPLQVGWDSKGKRWLLFDWEVFTPEPEPGQIPDDGVGKTLIKPIIQKLTELGLDPSKLPENAK